DRHARRRCLRHVERRCGRSVTVGEILRSGRILAAVVGGAGGPRLYAGVHQPPADGGRGGPHGPGSRQPAAQQHPLVGVATSLVTPGLRPIPVADVRLEPPGKQRVSWLTKSGTVWERYRLSRSNSARKASAFSRAFSWVTCSAVT